MDLMDLLHQFQVLNEAVINSRSFRSDGLASESERKWISSVIDFSSSNLGYV
jgi:hypothetical protein